jgi:serine/threonine protein kinase/regulator of sirC expression with transglutaminase-like and TPR domain
MHLMGMNLLRLFQQTNQTNPDKPLGGRYKIVSQLGEGGFGQTFLAQDLHLPGQPTCVVKQLKPQVSDAESLQTARRLFDTEAKVLYQLGSHDQIPRLLAHFEDNQEFYLAQELVEGGPLSEELVSGEPWSEARVIALLQDMLYVLAFVHQQHVIHRDIKPSNLMRRSWDGRIVLIDFGAVKQVTTQMANPKAGRTNLTISIGTQGYMPKEQLGGNPRFSSDVYAVGIIGIQALTGLHPRFLPEDPQTGEIQWHEQAKHASPEFIAVLDKMVRYDFRARYVTAANALEALRSLPEELLETVPPPQPLPEVSRAAPTQELSPPTATGQTQPIMGLASNNNPPPPPEPQPSAGVAPTVTVGAGQSSQPLPASMATVTLQGFIQKHPIKPWHGIAALAAVVVTFSIGKAFLSPQPAPQTASSGSVSTKSTAATAPSPAAPANSPAATTAEPEQEAAALLSQADRFRKAESYQEAIGSYERAIALKPGEATAHWGLCYSLNQMGKFTEAIAACDQALALKPNYPEALWSKGSAYEEQKDYNKAIEVYDQALKLKPDYAEAWNNKGVALLNLNKPKEAFEALEKATTYKPDWPDAWANRGTALWSLKRYDQAIESIGEAIKLDPDHPNANNLRQQARRKLGRDIKVKGKK